MRLVCANGHHNENLPSTAHSSNPKNTCNLVFTTTSSGVARILIKGVLGVSHEPENFDLKPHPLIMMS